MRKLNLCVEEIFDRRYYLYLEIGIVFQFPVRSVLCAVPISGEQGCNPLDILPPKPANLC